MKKTLITLLVISLFSFNLFADGGGTSSGPGPSSFEVKTTVASLNLMRLTTKSNTETTESAFSDLTNYPTFAGPVDVTTHGPQSVEAYISTLSNSRVGYKVSMSATPMNSTEGSNTATIHYSVTANGKTVDTSNASDGSGSNAKIIIDTQTNGLSGVAAESHKITLSVDQTTFEAAVEGTYTGTVTFTWTTS